MNEWKEFALCKGKTDLFYVNPGDDQRPAKAICAECPVRRPCLEYALVHEPFGIWGGLSGRERQRLRLQRKQMRLLAS